MLNLIWSPTAREDLRAILDFVVDRNPAAALRLEQAINDCAERLPSHPYMYRAGRTPGTREAVVIPTYLLIYEVHLEVVEIMAVVHSSREYPPSE